MKVKLIFRLNLKIVLLIAMVQKGKYLIGFFNARPNSELLLRVALIGPGIKGAGVK